MCYEWEWILILLGTIELLNKIIGISIEKVNLR